MLLIVGVSAIIITTFVSIIILLFSSGLAALPLLIITVIAMGLLGFEVYIAYKNIKKYVLRLYSNLILAQKESLSDFPAPVLIVDEENTIVWANRLFEEKIASEKEAFGNDLTTLIPMEISKIYSQNGCVIEKDGFVYRIEGRKVKSNEKIMTLVYFNDITNYKMLETEYNLSRPTVILVMIDNYDDLLANVKESEKANILVQLEKLFEDFEEETSGVISRVAKDRFKIVVEERYVQQMMDKKVDILDKARAIAVDERLSVTLSIGVGRSARTMSLSELYAKQALDMSLGRGGDQCAVKTINGFEFFGGVSKAVEKRTKVKTRIIATALTELLESSQNVLIMGHRFGDLDSLGAAIGLSAAIRRKGKPAHVVVDPDKNLAKQLIEHIEKNDIPDLFLSPDVAKNYVNENTLLIVVDTHNPNFVESGELLASCKQIIVIDHHRKMVNYIDNAVIFYHEPYASSACEMVAELIQYLDEKNRISHWEAEALLSGIMLDTKNFIMRTGVRTFEAAAFLRKLGADTVTVKSMFSNNIETYQEKSALVADAEIYSNCAIACTDSNSEEIRIAAPQAADELLGIIGVAASFVVFDINGVVNISARSLGGYNVQLIMEAMGGGGHQTMAGTQIKDITVQEAKDMLIKAISDLEEKSA